MLLFKGRFLPFALKIKFLDKSYNAYFSAKLSG
jgi:hypothetical protein